MKKKTNLCVFLLILQLTMVISQPVIAARKRLANQDSKQKAVLVVGYHKEATAKAIVLMDKVAAFLQKKGFQVFRFYNDRADWEKIKKASVNASVFVYAGHGTNLGQNGTSGGLCIKTDVSSEQIQKELKLKENAMVLLQSVCRAAGSTASDNATIGADEALKRVIDYSQPFIEAGAGCYYATNLLNDVLIFLTEFFTGSSVLQCYSNSIYSWARPERFLPYVHCPQKRIYISSSDWGGTSKRTTYVNGVKKVEIRNSFREYDAAMVADTAMRINYWYPSGVPNKIKE